MAFLLWHRSSTTSIFADRVGQEELLQIVLCHSESRRRNTSVYWSERKLNWVSTYLLKITVPRSRRKLKLVATNLPKIRKLPRNPSFSKIYEATGESEWDWPSQTIHRCLLLPSDSKLGWGFLADRCWRRTRWRPIYYEQFFSTSPVKNRRKTFYFFKKKIRLL